MKLILGVVNNRRGMSLVEVMIAGVIMAIIGAAVMSMITDQNKEANALSEKMAALDTERLLINSLASGTICTTELATTVFNAAGPFILNTTSLATQIINLPSVHATNVVGAPTLIAANEQASGLAKNLKVDTINFKNFVSAGAADLYLTDLEVTLKGGIRQLKPILIRMIVETKATDPVNAKSIINCTESGKSDKSYRFKFFSSTTWTVPAGVRSAFVTAAGGGGSGMGWRLVNAIFTGHSGGYVFSEPINLVPGETITITVGHGGVGHGPTPTGGPAVPGPPYFIHVPPASGDSGLGGYPGGSTKIDSPLLGTLIECAGGSGHAILGVDGYDAANRVAGNLQGALTGSGTPSIPSPNRVATGSFATPNGPGACGLSGYGVGNTGMSTWGTSNSGPPSGYYPGGGTPFGFGSGGAVGRWGCFITFTTIGTCTFPQDGRDGVVYIDVRY